MIIVTPRQTFIFKRDRGVTAREPVAAFPANGPSGERLANHKVTVCSRVESQAEQVGEGGRELSERYTLPFQL